MKRKILSTIMVLMLMINCVYVSAAENLTEKESTNKIMINEQFVNDIVKSNSKSLNTFLEEKSQKGLSYNLNHIEDDQYDVTGVIDLPGGSYDYLASGKLYEVKLSSGEIGLIGNVTGKIKDSDSTKINITIHSIEKLSKDFIFVTVGSYGEKSTLETLAYGEMFEEMTALVTSYEKKSNIQQNIDIEKESSLSKDSKATPDDYNTQLQKVGYSSVRTYSGNTYKMAALSFYGPDRMESNKVYASYAKINSDVSKANSFAREQYIIIGTLNTWVEGGNVEMYTYSKDMSFTNFDPEDESWSISLPIPYISGGSFGTLPWSFTATFNAIDFTKSKFNSSTYYNKATWEYNVNKNIDWASSGAESTTKGYIGQMDFKCLRNSSLNQYIYMYAEGDVEYSFSGMYGAQQYSGGFTVDCPNLSYQVTVDAMD